MLQTYIDCLHIKKTDKSRMFVEDVMDVDGQDRNAEVLFDEEKVQFVSIFYEIHCLLYALANCILV